MAKSSPAKLKYMAEYQARPENVDKRVQNNKARRAALREGVVHKHDGKEIDHKVPMDVGGSSDKSNLRVVSASENRAWRKRTPGMYGKNK